MFFSLSLSIYIYIYIDVGGKTLRGGQPETGRDSGAVRVNQKRLVQSYPTNNSQAMFSLSLSIHIYVYIIH